MADRFITSLAFSEEAVEVSFLENQEQTEKVSLLKTMIVDMTDKREDYVDLQRFLSDLVDDAYIALRNPPQQFTEGESRIRRERGSDEPTKATADL